jgi:hypothetical protein
MSFFLLISSVWQWKLTLANRLQSNKQVQRADKRNKSSQKVEEKSRRLRMHSAHHAEQLETLLTIAGNSSQNCERAGEEQYWRAWSAQLVAALYLLLLRARSLAGCLGKETRGNRQHHCSRQHSRPRSGTYKLLWDCVARSAHSLASAPHSYYMEKGEIHLWWWIFSTTEAASHNPNSRGNGAPFVPASENAAEERNPRCNLPWTVSKKLTRVKSKYEVKKLDKLINPAAGLINKT